METGTQVLFWEFQQPGRLWALLAIPVLVIVYIVVLHLRKHRGIRYTNTGIVGAVVAGGKQWRRHVAVAMSLCSLAAITGAWAVPLGEVEVPRERATIVLVMDISQSMQATDVSPNRLAAAQEAATQFVAKLPSKYNVSLVTLSGHPNTLVPPTTDRTPLNQAIKTLTLTDGTAIADSIDVGLEALKQAPASDDGSQAPGLMVMLSDGTETGGGDPLAAAQRAKDASVPIYTIAFGTQNGYVDLDGERFNVAPDPQMLQQIADTSSGKALDASTAGELDDVYTTLSSDVGKETVRTETTAQWALYSLAFGLVAALGAVSMATRWPR
jgi:Ca-activated chloride channel family protein